MASANNEAECLRQNLFDAKCSDELSERCMALSGEGQSRMMISILRSHRKELLSTIHEYQKALDSLDYLLFRTEKEQRTGVTP
ncbi:MAG: hypothetical protein IKE27_11425 [Oscillospiraceae bacterium]|nr:hypothetical protein [Oscillospiraceae bacterium]